MPVDREAPPQALTPLAAAIAARPRRVELLNVAGIFGLAGEDISLVAQRVMTKAEEDQAVKAARQYVSTLAGADAIGDADVMTDAKNVEAMFRACRDPRSPDAPLFPGPQWMREHLTTDQLAALLNGYAETRRKNGGADWGIDDERIEAIAAACVHARDTDIPEMVLASVPREALSSVVVLLSLKLHAARNELAALAESSAEATPT